MLQLIIHLFSDYWTQSDYMALNKQDRTVPCLIHCILYTIPFMIFTTDILPLSLIFVTHFIEDRYGLVKYVIWLKNHLNPTFKYYPFKNCSVTGYHDDWLNDPNKEGVRPKFITTWLYIITDNSYHLTCNYYILSTFL